MTSVYPSPAAGGRHEPGGAAVRVPAHPGPALRLAPRIRSREVRAHHGPGPGHGQGEGQLLVQEVLHSQLPRASHRPGQEAQRQDLRHSR